MRIKCVFAIFLWHRITSSGSNRNDFLLCSYLWVQVLDPTLTSIYLHSLLRGKNGQLQTQPLWDRGGGDSTNVRLIVQKGDLPQTSSSVNHPSLISILVFALVSFLALMFVLLRLFVSERQLFFRETFLIIPELTESTFPMFARDQQRRIFAS